VKRWLRSNVVAPLQVAFAALLLLAPRAVHACSVCVGTQEGDTRTAFILMTAFMTFLPLTMIGGIVWWLRRRFRELELEESRAVQRSH